MLWVWGKAEFEPNTLGFMGSLRYPPSGVKSSILLTAINFCCPAPKPMSIKQGKRRGSYAPVRSAQERASPRDSPATISGPRPMHGHAVACTCSGPKALGRVRPAERAAWHPAGGERRHPPPEPSRGRTARESTCRPRARKREAEVAARVARGSAPGPPARSMATRDLPLGASFRAEPGGPGPVPVCTPAWLRFQRSAWQREGGGIRPGVKRP